MAGTMRMDDEGGLPAMVASCVAATDRACMKWGVERLEWEAPDLSGTGRPGQEGSEAS